MLFIIYAQRDGAGDSATKLSRLLNQLCRWPSRPPFAMVVVSYRKLILYMHAASFHPTPVSVFSWSIDPFKPEPPARKIKITSPMNARFAPAMHSLVIMRISRAPTRAPSLVPTRSPFNMRSSRSYGQICELSRCVGYSQPRRSRPTTRAPAQG